MNINWKRFAFLLLVSNTALLLMGCGWASALPGLWQAISVAITAVFSFVSAIHSLPPAVQATVDKIKATVTAAVAAIGDMVAALVKDPTATLAARLNDALQALMADLNSILTAAGITDQNVIAKVTQLVGLALAAIEAIIAILPLAQTAAAMDEKQLAHADKVTTINLKNSHKVLQQDYHATVTSMTQNAEVDEALAALPQTLP